DLKPLAGMPLAELQLVGTQVKSIEPLRGAPLEGLWLNDTAVADLAPLTQSPLVSLTLHRAPVSDLSPLSGIKSLRRLHIAETRVHDLTPLRGLSLERLIFTPSQIKTGLEVVRGMPSLQELGTTLEGKIAPDGFWRLLDAGQLK
nr:hypothetical protein [Verrucomicrobiota bacterium]